MRTVQDDEHFMLAGIEQRGPAVVRKAEEGLPKRNKLHFQHHKGLDSFAGQRTKSKSR